MYRFIQNENGKWEIEKFIGIFNFGFWVKIKWYYRYHYNNPPHISFFYNLKVLEFDDKAGAEKWLESKGGTCKRFIKILYSYNPYTGVSNPY